MRINGEWFFCDDGIERPIARGEVLASDGSWVETHFLLDTGADRTVFSATILTALNYQAEVKDFALAGLGGKTNSVIIKTQIVFPTITGGRATFRGEFAAVTDYEALDFSVLGRDITGLLAVIVDQPNRVVSLLRQPHHYKIVQG